MQHRLLPVLDSGPYPGPVPSDIKIWKTLPQDLRNAVLETLARVEKQLIAAPHSSKEEHEFHNELRAAMIVAIGVLREASLEEIIKVTTSKREGNA